MWCQFTTPDSVSGQVSIAIWPLYSLYNALPLPLQWRTSATSPDPSPTWTPPSDVLKRGSAGVPAGDHGHLQPGEETPLAVAIDAGQSLSFRLGPEHGLTLQTSPDQGPTPSKMWSTPLLTQPTGKSNVSAGFPADQSAAVPDAGLWQAIHIACDQGNSLSCMLVAQPGVDQIPMVTLCLIPHAVLHNSLPFPVGLELLSAEGQLPVAAGRNQALDWSCLSYRPKKVALSVTEAQGTRLQSQAFALDVNHDSQLTFTGNETALHSVSASESHGISFYAAVRVHNEPFEIRPGREGAGESHTMEVTHISITPATFVTNLTQYQLSLQLQGQQPEAAGQLPQLLLQQPLLSVQQASTASQQQNTWHGQEADVGQRQVHQPQLAYQHQHQQQQQQQSWQLSCGPSQTMPVLNAWRHPVESSPHRSPPHPASTAATLAATVRLYPSTASSHPTSPKPAPSNASPRPQAAAHHDSMGKLHAMQMPTPLAATQDQSPDFDLGEGTVALMQPSGRRHLQLTEPQQQQPVLVAYKSVLSQGRLHLVFFPDPQPPCVIHSTAAEAMDVQWCTLHRDKHGVLQEQCSREVVALAAGGSVECSPRSCFALQQPGEASGELSFISCAESGCAMDAVHSHVLWYSVIV